MFQYLVEAPLAELLEVVVFSLTIWVSHVSVEEFWPTLVYENCTSVHCSHLIVHRSQEIPPQYLSQVEVRTFWAFSLPLQLFSCRFAAVLGILVMLNDPFSAKLQLSDRSTTVLYSWYEVFVQTCHVWVFMNHQISSLWSNLWTGHCARRLEISSDATFQS